MIKKNMISQSSSQNLEPSKPEVSAELYNQVVDAAELSSVQMVNLKFDVKPSFFKSKKREFHYDGSIKYIDFDAENGNAIALTNFIVEARSGKSKILVCKADYICAYNSIVDCDKAAIDTYLRRVAIFAAYPYFRSLFASLDWAASTSMPILPVMRQKAPKASE